MRPSAVMMFNVPARSQQTNEPSKRHGALLRVRRVKNCFKLAAGIIATTAAGFVIYKTGLQNPVASMTALSMLCGSLAVCADGVENLVGMAPTSFVAASEDDREKADRAEGTYEVQIPDTSTHGVVGQYMIGGSALNMSVDGAALQM